MNAFLFVLWILCPFIKKALKCLLTTSKDSSSYIRAATATALASLGDVDVRTTLEGLAYDTNENVRRAARRGLEKL